MLGNFIVCSVCKLVAVHLASLHLQNAAVVLSGHAVPC